MLFDPAALTFDPLDLASLAGYHALFTLEPAWRRRHGFKSRLHLSPKDLPGVVGLVDRLDEELRARLFELREQRPKPLRDDKAIASWNGLALAALAEAGRRLERPEWVDAAQRLAEFLLGPLSDEEGRLCRSWREGRTSGQGYLDDYANVAHGLLELHVATGDLRWLREAHRLAKLAVELFAEFMPGENLRHAQIHRDTIARFGRFPWRNAALGRSPTPAESRVMEGGGYGALVSGKLSLDGLR